MPHTPNTEAPELVLAHTAALKEKLVRLFAGMAQVDPAKLAELLANPERLADIEFGKWLRDGDSRIRTMRLG